MAPRKLELEMLPCDDDMRTVKDTSTLDSRGLATCKALIGWVIAGAYGSADIEY